MSSNLAFSDNVVILIYFLAVLLIGLLSAKYREISSEEYFLAGRKLGWIAIGFSLFATNISSEHLIGLAGAGSGKGLVIGQFEWFAILILFSLGWFFAPFFLKSNIYTMPQFIGKRFDHRSRTYLTGLSLVVYFFTKIAVTLIAGGYLLREVLKWDMFTSVVFLVLLTGIYTLVGGMMSVVKTQIFQSVVLLLGAAILTIYGIKAVGGFSALQSSLPDDYFSIFKPISDPDFPWTGIILGAPILGIWYWCTDQYIVQRILCAKDVKSVKKGAMLTAVLKFFPIFLFIIPGLIAVILSPELQGDQAYSFLLLGDVVPVGLKGVVIAGLFAALMSSLSSAFNSSATLIAIDIYKPRRPDASDHEIVLIGRLATTAIVLLSITIIPAVKNINSYIYIILQSVQAFISPPIVVVFLLGILWKKASGRAAIWTLVIGGGIGVFRIILALMDQELVYGYALLSAIAGINFLHFAVILFVISGGIMIAISVYDFARKGSEDSVPSVAGNVGNSLSVEIEDFSIKRELESKNV